VRAEVLAVGEEGEGEWLMDRKLTAWGFMWWLWERKGMVVVWEGRVTVLDVGYGRYWVCFVLLC
jgi:hypothetical protein